MASHFRTGWEHQKRGEYEEAVKYYKLAIEAGHEGAKFHLDCMYSGQGIPRNDVYISDDCLMSDASVDELLEYYFELNGHPHIQNNIGLLYKIYKKDFDEAERWYMRSADQDYVVALNNLGCLFQRKKEYAKMNEYYLLASYKGYSGAQNGLGYSYQHGRGLTQDYERAIYWFSKATTQRHGSATRSLGIMYDHGHGVPQNREEARRLYLKAIEYGDIMVYNDIGFSYENDISPNYEKAREYYLLGAQNGNLTSYSNLATLYHTMKVWVDPDSPNKIALNHDEVYKWYSLADQWTNSMYQYNFSVFYEDKETQYHDYSKMMKYLTLSADQGHELAIQRRNFYLSLKDRMVSALKLYNNQRHNEGISYLFFGNFLAHLNRTFGALTWNDPMLRPWITEALTNHFKTLKSDFDSNIIDTWYSDFYD